MVTIAVQNSDMFCPLTCTDNDMAGGGQYESIGSELFFPE